MLMAEKEIWIRGRTTAEVKRIFDDLVEELGTTAEDLLASTFRWLKSQPPEVRKAVAANLSDAEILSLAKRIRERGESIADQADRIATDEMRRETDRAAHRRRGKGA